MRLVNANTMELEEFLADDVPEYAILSHTWAEDEASFQEFVNRPQAVSHRKGFAKINMVCGVAKNDGIKYAWVDTCCIDKSSSAELSEAINSMFTWYQSSKVCYALLSDVTQSESAEETRSRFLRSRWFTRGWCLQELLAPSFLVFYDADSKLLGTRDQWAEDISNITGIHPGILTGHVPIASCSVAQRMSWAANRNTTRSEDIAYCLLGIFGVNMPLLYGQGPRAFIRLQEEIIKQTHDLSIFAWRTEAVVDEPHSGLLATSPHSFRLSRNIRLLKIAALEREFLVTHKGIKFDDFRIECVDHPAYLWKLPLVSIDTTCPSEGIIGIYLRQVAPDVFVRALPSQFSTTYGEPGKTSMYAKHLSLDDKNDWLEGSDLLKSRKYTFYVPKAVSSQFLEDMADLLALGIHFSSAAGFKLCGAYPSTLWNNSSQSFLTLGASQFIGFLMLKCNKCPEDHQPIVVLCGFFNKTCWCSLTQNAHGLKEVVLAWETSMYSGKIFSFPGTPYKKQTLSLPCCAAEGRGRLLSVTVNTGLHNTRPMWMMQLKLWEPSSESFEPDENPDVEGFVPWKYRGNC